MNVCVWLSNISQANDTRLDGGRPSQVEKSHSFGGYGPQSQTRIVRGDSVNSTKSAVLNKQDSNQQTWRLSPSSSGYVYAISFSIFHFFRLQTSSIMMSQNPSGVCNSGLLINDIRNINLNVFFERFFFTDFPMFFFYS